MITCHQPNKKSWRFPHICQAAPEAPAPDASGFCAFHLNPTSTKWHWVTLSIVPGAWQKKGLRPPEEVTRNANRSHLESDKKLKKRSNIDFLYLSFPAVASGVGDPYLQSWLCSGEKSREIQQCANQRKRDFPLSVQKTLWFASLFLNHKLKKKQDYKNEN